MAPDRRSAARLEADRSFEQLYEGLRHDVYRASLRELRNVEDAEDVTQAAFVDAYRAILRGSRPRAPRAWLLAIAENVRRRRFRTALRRPREEPLDFETTSSMELANEQADSLRAALGELPRQQLEVFLLREVSGLSYDEIAERVGSTVAAVQMLLFRARRSLRAELDPPSGVRRGALLGLPLPGWLAHLIGRGETLVPASRGLGSLGAAALAVTAITAGAGPRPHEQQPQDAVRASALAALTSVSAGGSTAPRAHVPALSAAPVQATTDPPAARPMPVATQPRPTAAPPRPAAAPVSLPTAEEASPPPPVPSTPPTLPPPPPSVSRPAPLDLVAAAAPALPPPRSVPALVPTAPPIPPVPVVPPPPDTLPAPPDDLSPPLDLLATEAPAVPPAPPVVPQVAELDKLPHSLR